MAVEMNESADDVLLHLSRGKAGAMRNLRERQLVPSMERENRAGLDWQGVERTLPPNAIGLIIGGHVRGSHEGQFAG